MAHSGGVPKDPAEQLQRGEELLQKTLQSLENAGLTVGHPDLCPLLEKVCGWLQAAYIDGGEPREKRRSLAKQCDALGLPSEAFLQASDGTWFFRQQ